MSNIGKTVSLIIRERSYEEGKHRRGNFTNPAKNDVNTLSYNIIYKTDIMLRLFIITLNICALATSVPLLGNVYGNTKLSDEKIFTGIRERILSISGVAIAKKSAPLHAVTDHNFRKQFARSKLARGSALSSKCNSRCSAKTPCNKRCQLARDKYQLQLAKTKYKKDNVKNIRRHN